MTDPVKFPTPAQLVDRVPLIKNPGFYIPKPVEVPLDIHPLPDDVQAYFVYPHKLESHVLSTLPATLSQLETTRQQRLALLASYAESKERARKAELNRLAPGYQEGNGVMQPLRATTAAGATRNGAQEGDLLLPQEGQSGDPETDPNRLAAPTDSSATAATSATPDIFKDFVDGLEKLDSTLGGSGGGGASANRTADVDNLI